MRQAIEEGFILDVLKNYTTYKTYYRLVKAIDDDPQVSKSKAAKALARFMSLHPHNIAQKTEVMLEHFHTFTRHKIGGRAKAMVVTGSRLHAVRYKQEFDRQIKEKGYTDIKTLVAFSGTVEDPDAPGVSYTEPDMNRDSARPAHPREGIAGQVCRPRSTSCYWSPKNTRPASISRCCTRCTWTSGSTASRPYRRSPASTVPALARRTPSFLINIQLHCDIKFGNCRRSSRLSPSTNVIVCAALIAMRPPVPNYRQGFPAVRRAAAWSPLQPC